MVVPLHVKSISSIHMMHTGNIFNIQKYSPFNTLIFIQPLLIIIISSTCIILIGLLLSLKECFIILGIIIGFSVGYMYSTKIGGWIYVYLISFPFSIVMFFGMLLLPFSSRWLVMKGRIIDAKNSVQFISKDYNEIELHNIREIVNKIKNKRTVKNHDKNIPNNQTNKNIIQNDYQKNVINFQNTNQNDSNQNNNKNNKNHSKNNKENYKHNQIFLYSPTIYPALVTGLGLVIFQQISGQPSSLYYIDSIFKDIGLSTFVSIYVSLFQLTSTLFTAVIVDKQGRKMMLFVGCFMMAVSLFSIGTAFLFPYSNNAKCNTFLTPGGK